MVYCVALLSSWAQPAWVRIPYALRCAQVRNLVTGVRFTVSPSRTTTTGPREGHRRYTLAQIVKETRARPCRWGDDADLIAS